MAFDVATSEWYLKIAVPFDSPPVSFSMLNSASSPNGHTRRRTSRSVTNDGRFMSMRTFDRIINGLSEAGLPAPKAPIVGSGCAEPSPYDFGRPMVSVSSFSFRPDSRTRSSVSAIPRSSQNAVVPSSATQTLETAPDDAGRTAFSAPFRNCCSWGPVMPKGRSLTKTSRFGFEDWSVAVAVAVAADCAASARPCAAPAPTMPGCGCMPAKPMRPGGIPGGIPGGVAPISPGVAFIPGAAAGFSRPGPPPALAWMPDICFMIWSLASASWTLRFGFSFITTVRLSPCAGTCSSSSLDVSSRRRRRLDSSGRASGMPPPMRPSRRRRRRGASRRIAAPTWTVQPTHAALRQSARGRAQRTAAFELLGDTRRCPLGT
mmetsp:Transcript_25622/g.76946  ORF Transcript_25622/g.76946 Transcript_25622/m.76946 type:complete len:375 (+) Transcript_25622:531-1655(+)